MPMSPCATSRFMPLCWQKRVLQLVSRHHTRTHVIPDSDKDVPSVHNSHQPFAVIHLFNWKHCCMSGPSPSDEGEKTVFCRGKKLFVFHMFIPLFCSPSFTGAHETEWREVILQKGSLTNDTNETNPPPVFIFTNDQQNAWLVTHLCGCVRADECVRGGSGTFPHTHHIQSHEWVMWMFGWQIMWHDDGVKCACSVGPLMRKWTHTYVGWATTLKWMDPGGLGFNPISFVWMQIRKENQMCISAEQ